MLLREHFGRKTVNIAFDWNEIAQFAELLKKNSKQFYGNFLRTV